MLLSLRSSPQIQRYIYPNARVQRVERPSARLSARAPTLGSNSTVWALKRPNTRSSAHSSDGISMFWLRFLISNVYFTSLNSLMVWKWLFRSPWSNIQSDRWTCLIIKSIFLEFVWYEHMWFIELYKFVYVRLFALNLYAWYVGPWVILRWFELGNVGLSIWTPKNSYMLGSQEES